MLEVLREPLESGLIHISRATQQAVFPARFQLIAAMNPCPCGYLGSHNNRCRCTSEQITRYRHRVSGPLLDRIDMHIEVPYLPPSQLAPENQSQENQGQLDSQTARAQTVAAYERQMHRCGKANHRLSTNEIKHHCHLSGESTQLLENACEHLGLSARAHHRILRVARTIADLAAVDAINNQHLAEAIAYRRLDRRYDVSMGKEVVSTTQ